jgi:hypothetical protein
MIEQNPALVLSRVIQHHSMQVLQDLSYRRSRLKVESPHQIITVKRQVSDPQRRPSFKLQSGTPAQRLDLMQIIRCSPCCKSIGVGDLQQIVQKVRTQICDHVPDLRIAPVVLVRWNMLFHQLRHLPDSLSRGTPPAQDIKSRQCAHLVVTGMVSSALKQSLHPRLSNIVE